MRQIDKALSRRAAALELAHVRTMGLFTLKVGGRAWTRDASRAYFLTVVGCEMGQPDTFDPSDRTVVDSLSLDTFTAARREACEELAP